MCGRYGLTVEQEAIGAAYGVERILLHHEPRFNIAPTQDVPVLLADGDGRRIQGLRWGLVPFWAADISIGNRLINARSESVASKPSFRNAWKHNRRCLVLADGFYEWQKPESGSGPKIPHWIHMADQRPFGFAGLWERWEKADEPLHTCTILTTKANDLVKPIHDRMPVIFGDRAAWDAWVHSDIRSDDVAALLAPYPSEEMHAYPVSTFVNRPGNDGTECVEPLTEG